MKVPVCHPERRHKSFDMCAPCYNKRWRTENVQHVRKTYRAYVLANRESLRVKAKIKRAKTVEYRATYRKSYIHKHPFVYRASQFNNQRKALITGLQLLTLWHQQKGLCALTCRKLNILTAELDHITPLSCGGSNDLSNLRFTCREVNRSKHRLTDSEFFQLCSEVVSYAQQGNHA